MSALGRDTDKVVVVTAVSVVVGSLLVIDNGNSHGHQNIVDSTANLVREMRRMK